MSGDDGKLIARLGPVGAAVEAVNLALVSNGSGESDLSRLQDGDEDYLIPVVCALANLAALLARTVIRAQLGPGPSTSDAAEVLLHAIRDDQEVRAARDCLGALDDEWPFDA